MLGDIGSWFSIVGVAVSLLGLGFAIWQLMRVKATAEAAREAAEAARSALRRELTATEITRVLTQLELLTVLHRTGNREGALSLYHGIVDSLHQIRSQHPDIGAEQSSELSDRIAEITAMEADLESLTGGIPQELAVSMNNSLSELRTLLLELRHQIPPRKA